MHQRWSAPALGGLGAALLASCGSPPRVPPGRARRDVGVLVARRPRGGECRGSAISVDDASVPGRGVDLSQGRQSAHVVVIDGGSIVDAGATRP